MRVDQLIVPHMDDEIVFLWTLLGEAHTLSVIADAGYTRLMEGRVGLRERHPSLRLELHRLREPIPSEASWRAPVPRFAPLSFQAVVEDALVHADMEKRVIAIPGANEWYGHPHHLQLQEALDAHPQLEFICEQHVGLSRAQQTSRLDALIAMYPSERDGFLHSRKVLQYMQQGQVDYRVYRIKGAPCASPS